MAFNLFGGATGGMLSGVGSTFQAIISILLIGIPAFLIVGGILYWLYKKKKWNLDVEFKLPRSDGMFVNAEWGKGNYDIKRGVVWLKRKKKRKAPMKPFAVDKYLQGNQTLTVVQIGPEDYIPVLNESFMEMEDDEPSKDKNGRIIKDGFGNPIYEKAALIKLRVSSAKDKAWKNSFERESKSTYSIMSLLHEYAVPISIGLVIILWGIQFIILYTRIK